MLIGFSIFGDILIFKLDGIIFFKHKNWTHILLMCSVTCILMIHYIDRACLKKYSRNHSKNMSNIWLPYKIALSRFYATKQFYQRASNVTIAPWVTRRILRLFRSHADLNTVAPEEHMPDTSARLDTLELENIGIKSIKDLALHRGSRVMTEVSIWCNVKRQCLV